MTAEAPEGNVTTGEKIFKTKCAQVSKLHVVKVHVVTFSPRVEAVRLPITDGISTTYPCATGVEFFVSPLRGTETLKLIAFAFGFSLDAYDHLSHFTLALGSDPGFLFLCPTVSRI